jgi:hypothetical protein
MTFPDSIEPDRREAIEIDALQRSLRNLKHWTAASADRRGYADDRGRRLFATATALRDIAWADSLRSAYRLFEIDAIHQAWLDADGRGR